MPINQSSERSLVFVTGTRADFGKTLPLARIAKQVGYKVSYFVTGMHMSQQYGLTKEEVHEQVDGDVFEFINQRDGDPQDIVIAKTILGFSDFLQENNPHLVFVHGDRVEALACAVCCATNYVRCIHIEGGEVSGTIDETFRHCISKLSWAHLASSSVAATRLSRLGEEDERIFVIGSPEIDIHRNKSKISLDQVLDRYEIQSRDFGICIYHPVTSEIPSLRSDVDAFIGELEKSNRFFVMIKPNNDPGSEIINERLSALPSSHFKLIPSMRFLYFSVLLQNAQCMVGNSSTGVREAPSIGVPSLNIGTRQNNRAISKAIFTCSPEDSEAIQSFLKTQWGKRYSFSNAFGSGDANNRFAAVIEDEKLWALSMQKYFSDA